MPRSTRRGPWLPDEDGTLLHLVHLQGPNNWVRISQHMEHRSPKQCRERYHQNLKPNLNHEPISPEEGDVIEQLVQDMGKRWAEIARRLGNRSDNAVKNWYNGSLNRRKRHHISSVVSRGVGPRPLPIPATGIQSRDGDSTHRFSTASAAQLSPSDYQPLYHASSNLQREDDQAAPFSTTDAPTVPSQDSESHHQSFSLPQPFLRPTFLETQSAPPSSNKSPYPHLLPSRQLSPDAQKLKPPPLESRHSFPSQWQPLRSHIDYPAMSPAASEFSNLPPSHPPPSLISDNQSHYSISPKTVSSPRPTLPALIDTSYTRTYYSDQRRCSYNRLTPETKYQLSDEGYVSAIPTSTTNEKLSRGFGLDSHFDRRLPYDPRSPIEPRAPVMPISSPTERDSRMNVSRLLD
jgi:Myb-like DNA-binding protein FlbD